MLCENELEIIEITEFSGIDNLVISFSEFCLFSLDLHSSRPITLESLVYNVLTVLRQFCWLLGNKFHFGHVL